MKRSTFLRTGITLGFGLLLGGKISAEDKSSEFAEIEAMPLGWDKTEKYIRLVCIDASGSMESSEVRTIFPYIYEDKSRSEDWVFGLRIRNDMVEIGVDLDRVPNDLLYTSYSNKKQYENLKNYISNVAHFHALENSHNVNLISPAEFIFKNISKDVLPWIMMKSKDRWSTYHPKIKMVPYGTWKNK